MGLSSRPCSSDEWAKSKNSNAHWTPRGKAVFRRMMDEGFSKGNLAVLDEVFASNFKEHQNEVVPPTVEGVKGLVHYLHTAFPDFRCTIQDMIAEGDMVCARAKGGGTHRGEFMGRAPTGKTVAIDMSHP